MSIFATAVGLSMAAVQPAFGAFVAPTVAFTETPSSLNVAGCAPTIGSFLGPILVNLGPAVTDNLFVVAPASSCQGNYAAEMLSLTFMVTTPGITTTGDPTETGWYKARYTLPTLPCASSDPQSTHGQSDCVHWDPANDLIKLVLGGDDAGYLLDITLHDAVDWNIVPTVSFELVSIPRLQVPEPGTLALLCLGLAGLAGSRRRKQ